MIMMYFAARVAVVFQGRTHATPGEACSRCK
jgi:hypothetical protein